MSWLKLVASPVCERHQQARPTRRSAPPRELAFNDCVGVDVIYLPLPGGQHKTRPALNIIDWSSKFQRMIPLTAKKPPVVREAYRQWIRIFGPSKRIALDMGREFRQAFATSAEEDGSFADPAAVEAPSQRGITERHGKPFKFMLLKAMDNYNCQRYKGVGTADRRGRDDQKPASTEQWFFSNAACFWFFHKNSRWTTIR